MKLNSFLTTILIASVLTGCGGGGGGSKSGSTSSAASSVDPSSPTAPLTSAQQNADATQAALNISGVYPVGTATDSTYIYIEPIADSKDLKITAFNYIGDSYDISHGSSGSNCYRVANGADTNAVINSPSTLTYIPAATNKEAPKYRLTMGTSNLTVEWLLARNNTQFELLNISAGGTTSQRVTGQLEGSSYAFGVIKDASLTYANIQTQMCTGDDLKAPTSTTGTAMPALKNYAGLYDVTLNDTTLSTPRKFEAYLQIDEDGTMNTYHYAGDGFNQGTDPTINKGNCYELSLAYNRSLNGTKIKYDSVAKQFYAYGGTDSKLFWFLDENANVTSVGIAIDNLNAKTPTSTGDAVFESGKLSISAKKAQSLTVETIKNQICK